MEQHKTIDQLKNYQFHDLEINSISLDSTNGIRLIVKANHYNDITADYKKFELIFSELIDLKMNELKLDENTEIEMYNFDYEYDQYFKCKLLFLFGFGKPSLEIDLNCNKIEIL